MGRARVMLELTDISINDWLIPIVSDRLGLEGDRADTLETIGTGAYASRDRPTPTAFTIVTTVTAIAQGFNRGQPA